MGILTVGVVTIPFYFEKKRKIIKALKGVDELRKNVDALLIVNNERLCDVYADADISMKEAFLRADNILMDAVKGISELITLPSDGGIKSDFRDVETTMKDGGGAIMAMGRASGEHRVEKAILNALDFDQLDPNIDVIWGTATDDNLGEDAKVTILATGMEEKLEDEIPANAYRNEDDYYEEVIKKLYKPVVKPTMATVITQQELPFEVEPAPEPEPAVVPEPEEEKEPTILDKWKVWLNNLMSVVTE